MDSSDLNDISSVRLASGVEMQQKWPPQAQIEHRQKNDKAPRLIEIAPIRGMQGTIITVVVQSLPHQFAPVKLAFNSLVVETKQMHSQGITSLVAAVPPFQQTHSATANVPISVCMLDKDSVTETWPVAEFIYEFETKEPIKTSIIAPTLATTTEPSSIEYPEKVTESQSSTYQSRGENFLGGSTVAYESYYQPANSYNNLNNQQMSQFPYQFNNTDNRGVYDNNKYNAYRLNNGSPAPRQQSMNYNNDDSNLTLFNPNNTSYSGILTGFNQTNSTLPAAIPQQSLGYTPHQKQQQQQKQPVPSSAYIYDKSTAHIPSTSVANYQPYPGLISRADLKIMGDLDSMAKNWTTEEWDNRRRLVQFWRKQNGNEIRCTFDPVTQSERITSSNGHIVVSCIYWAERNDCYITSVDCIHLLESLMDIRFSVEEKNRVRRNLEGFRPLTVSKCKAESADFFKLIMSFPNPKPRNIEKDVKVFPWKTLPYALKKIVTKYTASSYSNNGSQQQRCAQIDKNAATISTDTTTFMRPSTEGIVNQQQRQENMNNFYENQPNIYEPQQQYNAYQPQQQNEHPYQTSSSVPTYSSTYTQSEPIQIASPTEVVDNNSPSPVLRYNYNDVNKNSTTSPESLTATSAATTLNSNPPPIIISFKHE